MLSVNLSVLDYKLNCYLSVSILAALFSDNNWVSKLRMQIQRKENTGNIVENAKEIFLLECPSCDYTIHIVFTECITSHSKEGSNDAMIFYPPCILFLD